MFESFNVFLFGIQIINLISSIGFITMSMNESTFFGFVTGLFTTTMINGTIYSSTFILDISDNKIIMFLSSLLGIFGYMISFLMIFFLNDSLSTTFVLSSIAWPMFIFSYFSITRIVFPSLLSFFGKMSLLFTRSFKKRSKGSEADTIKKNE